MRRVLLIVVQRGFGDTVRIVGIEMIGEILVRVGTGGATAARRDMDEAEPDIVDIRPTGGFRTKGNTAT